MKVYLGKSKKEVDLKVYPAVKENEVYIEAFEGEKMLDGITMAKTEWDNRIEALKSIKSNLEKRFLKDESIYKPKNYDEFVKFCEQEGISQGSLKAKEKLRVFSAKVEDFFD